uniref:SWIM-type domain-containing protein n=1 Tax=Brassica oleracea var. oleracea TaxID=109376 RepID=A0A0D3BHH9_BRAOL
MAFEDFGIDQNLVELEGNNGNIGVDNEKSNSPFREQDEPSSFPPRDDSVSSSESSKDVEDNSNSNGYEEDDVLAISAKEDDSGKSVRFSLMDVVKRDETKPWYIRCKYNPCKWSVQDEGLSGSTYFIIKKYVADHTYAASSMNNGSRTASAKTIGGLIMHRGKGLAGLIAKASKAYRVIDFRSDSKLYDIRTTNPAESINSGLRTPREYPVIPLLDSIREMLTRWFFERRKQSRKHTKPLTIAIEKKIDMRINKGKIFLVQPVNEYRFLVRGDTIDCLVDLDRRTCSCGKYDLLKIPCRHAIKAGLTVGRAPSSLTDDMYTTSTWRTAYQETINPIEEEQEGEESADTRRLKTNSVHRKELKKKRGADAVDVAKRIIT